MNKDPLKIAVLERAAENAFQNGDIHLANALYSEIDKTAASTKVLKLKDVIKEAGGEAKLKKMKDAEEIQSALYAAQESLIKKLLADPKISEVLETRTNEINDWANDNALAKDWNIELAKDSSFKKKMDDLKSRYQSGDAKAKDEAVSLTKQQLKKMKADLKTEAWPIAYNWLGVQY